MSGESWRQQFPGFIQIGGNEDKALAGIPALEADEPFQGNFPPRIHRQPVNCFGRMSHEPASEK